MTKVEELWREVSVSASKAGVFRRIDESHPLDLYAGIDHMGKRVLLLVVHDFPPNLPPPGVVEVACNQRSDAEWAIVVQLARPEFEELFGRLCQDLIDSTRNATRDKGGELLLHRLGRWRRLLEVGHRRTLSEVELRGLIGELLFLKTVAIPRTGPDAAIKGWLGPLGASHDFLLFNVLVEIKTCIPGSNLVTIASLEQLDEGSEPLYLGVSSLASCPSTLAGAFTTALLVTDIRQQIDTSHAASIEFELRLAEAGYADGEEYTRSWYHNSATRYYRVCEEFPKLISSQIPEGIRDATYTIDLDSCGAFEIDFPME